MAFRFRNWARTDECRPRHYHQPRTEAEVVAIVRRAAAERRRVRVVGAGHSWNDIACTDDHLVNLDRLERLISVDKSRSRVRVEAGIRLKNLIARLDERGLALSNLGSITEQSIAGAISTGTHGSGALFGNLATQVIALRLVTADGNVRDLSATQDPDLFAAARVSLGCLGIVVAVTLQCEPAFDLEETSRAVPFDDAVARMQELVDAHQHVKIWWLPHTHTVQVYSSDRTTKPRTRSRAGHLFEQSTLLRAIFGVSLSVGERLPPAVPVLNRLVAHAYFAEHSWVDRSDRIFNTPMPPRHREMEFAIPREKAPDALVAMRELIDREALFVNFLQELRFVAADDALLSPAYGRATCQIGAYCGYGRDCSRFFSRFEKLMLPMSGRPHWGKEFTVAGAQIRSAYPAFKSFAEIRRRLDPDGVFENDYIRRVFQLLADDS
jgi:L-gulonolactone oxidase